MIKTSGPAAGRLTGPPPLLGGRRSAGGAQLSADIVPVNTSLHLTTLSWTQLKTEDETTEELELQHRRQWGLPDSFLCQLQEGEAGKNPTEIS